MNHPILPTGLVHGNVSTGYAVFSTTDERGTRGEMVAVSRDRNKADELSKGVGWYQGRGMVVTGTLFDGPDGLIFIERAAKVEELDTNLSDLFKKRRAAALAKLTPEEQKLLGVRD